jgi:hypothetical protein
MFDSNAMAELAALKRAKGGGRRKDGANKPVSSKAFYDAQMHGQMNPWRRAVYQATVRWRGDAASIAAGFKWDCHVLTLDTHNGEIPF